VFFVSAEDNMNFKDEHKIEVMLSTAIKGKAPREWGQSDWKQFHKTFHRTELTPYQLASLIYIGYPFTPLYRNGRRKEENFLAAWHMAFDFDNDGAALSHLLAEDSTAWLFASFAYSTPSSTDEHPKSRVVFVFDKPLETPEQTRELYQALAWRFEMEGSQTDPSCKDPLRLYYGSPGCEMATNWQVIKTKPSDERPSMVQFFIDEYHVANPPPLPPPINPTVTKLPASDGYVERIVTKLANHIRQAPDGEKHHVTNKIAYTLGGYVASGYLTEQAAIETAVSAITGNGQAKDIDAARRTIETAVRNGQQEPITIEQNYKLDMDEIL
jgi:hypothetical protein